MSLKKCRKLQMASTSGPRSLPSSGGNAGSMRTAGGGKGGRSGGGGAAPPSKKALQMRLASLRQDALCIAAGRAWGPRPCSAAFLAEHLTALAHRHRATRRVVVTSTGAGPAASELCRGRAPRVALLLLQQERVHLQVEVVPGPRVRVAVARARALPLLLRQRLQHVLLPAAAPSVSISRDQRDCPGGKCP